MATYTKIKHEDTTTFHRIDQITKNTKNGQRFMSIKFSEATADLETKQYNSNSISETQSPAVFRPNNSLTAAATPSATMKLNNNDSKIGNSKEDDCSPSNSCSKCKKSFMNGRSLKFHVKSAHSATPKKLFQYRMQEFFSKNMDCIICNLGFKNQFSLSRHFKTHHEDLDDYETKIKYRSFNIKTRKSQLSFPYSNRMHKDENPSTSDTF